MIFILFFLLVTYKRRMKSYSAKIGQSWERKLGYLRYFQKKQIKSNLLCVDRDKEGEQEVFKQREEATEVKPVKVRRYPTPKDLI